MTTNPKPQMTLGPVLFNWAPEKWRDFYFEVADESPVQTVYIGEVICSKRAPLFDPHMEEVVTRLLDAGKKLVFSTLSETASSVDRRLVKKIAASDGFTIEANDVSALSHIGDRPHHIGPYINTYNEESLSFFAGNGATSICIPPETPKSGIAELAKVAKQNNVALEVVVYGRIGLALSARCYHARAHGRTKDSCQFVCDVDPDGMVLETMEGAPFLAINGIQTMSYTCYNLINELEELASFGVDAFRISPQSTGTTAITRVFDDVINGRMEVEKAVEGLKALALDIPFSNGFYHRKSGINWQVSNSPDS